MKLWTWYNFTFSLSRTYITVPGDALALIMPMWLISLHARLCAPCRFSMWRGIIHYGRVCLQNFSDRLMAEHWQNTLASHGVHGYPGNPSPTSRKIDVVRSNAKRVRGGYLVSCFFTTIGRNLPAMLFLCKNDLSSKGCNKAKTKEQKKNKMEK